MVFWNTSLCAVMLLKLDGQNLSRNVLEQSHFFWEWNTRMLELIEQNDTEDEHGSLSRYKPTMISDTLQVRCSV